MLTARLASLFAGNNPEKVAMMVNGMSGIASAFTILFLFWTITHLALKLVHAEKCRFASGYAHANTEQIAQPFHLLPLLSYLEAAW